jgi:hypothetical protein
VKEIGNGTEGAPAEERGSSFLQNRVLMDAATSLATTATSLAGTVEALVGVGVAARINARSSANRIRFVSVIRS